MNPKCGPNIWIRLRPQTETKIRNIAKETGKPLSAVIRDLLEVATDDNRQDKIKNLAFRLAQGLIP